MVTLASAAAIYALVRFSKLDTFSFAWALNFLLMLCVVFFTEALKSPFSAPYFEEKPWENKGKVYDVVGVNYFRKLLVLIGWEKLIRAAYPINKDKEALTKLYRQTKKSELDHLIIFFIVLGFNVFVALKFGFVKSISLLVLNILLHVYPILLQRSNRPRIAKALKLSMRR